MAKEVLGLLAQKGNPDAERVLILHSLLIKSLTFCDMEATHAGARAGAVNVGVDTDTPVGRLSYIPVQSG